MYNFQQNNSFIDQNWLWQMQFADVCTEKFFIGIYFLMTISGYPVWLFEFVADVIWELNIKE
jgi:hypothetical protein